MPRSVISGNRNSISRDARRAFHIEGLKEIQENLSKVVSASTGRQMKEVYYDAGVMLRDQARANAPYDDERKRGTHLKDAIFVDWGVDSKPNVLVGVSYGLRGRKGAPHAHLIEYGWINRAGRRESGKPFMRPAIASTGPRIADHIKNGFLEIIRANTK